MGFSSGKKTYSSCIDFDSQLDKYQIAQLDLQHAVDQETLDVALNVNLSASAKGSIYLFSGSAQSSSGLNASYHYASTDETFISRASIQQGANFVIPSKRIGSIALKPAMAKLHTNNPDRFRLICGDGFVASIISGANLYVLYHFHDIDQKSRVEIEASFKASGGMGDIFSGTGSASLGSTIENYWKNNKLDIEFSQEGGLFTMLPVDLTTVKTKIQNLSAESNNGPRNIYMIVVPYTDLPGLNAIDLFTELDLRQRATRYFERLTTLYYEIMTVEQNYFRDRRPSANPLSNLYYYPANFIRLVGVVQLHDQILAELRLMSTIIRDLNSAACNGRRTNDKACANMRPTINAEGQTCDAAPGDDTCKTLSARVGIARHGIDIVRDLAKTKIASRSRRSLSEDATMQANLGIAEAALRSARAFLYEALDDAWAAVSAGQALGIEQRAMLWLATRRPPPSKRPN